MQQLIILGNGFDLNCGLNSSYNGFFLNRFSQLFRTPKVIPDNFNEIKDELREKIEELFGDIRNDQAKDCSFEESKATNNSKYLNFSEWIEQWTNEGSNANIWDIIFLFASLCIGRDTESYEWQDVESLILEVISIVLSESLSFTSQIEYNKNFYLLGENLQGKEAFIELVQYLLSFGDNSSSGKAEKLFNELKKFERNFANFINSQFDLEKSDYVKNAIKLVENISRSDFSKIDVLSFNYSLDERFVSLLKKKQDNRIKTWSNIHGIASFTDPNTKILTNNRYNNEVRRLPAPIFGVDNHDIILKNNERDLRISFTKPYRVLENNVNSVRKSDGYTNTNLISIYGHSLARADYSYFETIFDENNLYNSTCKIEYFYYPGGEGSNGIVERQEAITKLYKLLTDYGSTLGETHGSNLVNKLNLENRLSVIPTTDLD